MSRNNGFLQDIGVLTGGTRKALTGLGPDLARALEYDRHEDIERLWREIISDTDFLRSELSAVAGCHTRRLRVAPDDLCSRFENERDHIVRNAASEGPRYCPAPAPLALRVYVAK